MGMLEKDGDVVTEVIPDRTSKSLMPHIRDHVEKGSEVHTDEHKGYNQLDRTDDYERKSVNHSQEEYVGEDGETTNSIEGFVFAVEAHHRRNSHQRIPQAPRQIRQGMRIPVQPSSEPGVDAS